MFQEHHAIKPKQKGPIPRINIFDCRNIIKADTKQILR
jgi:hypothetical protein